jgi:hypothetical protein
VDRALKSKTAAWDADDLTRQPVVRISRLDGSNSFRTGCSQELFSAQRTYTISPQFRYTDDAASGAVQLEAPSSISVPANSTRSFALTLNVNANKLPVWNLNGGGQGGTGSLLQGVEFDGYLTLADRTDNIHLAWHLLPHRAAAVDPQTSTVRLRKDGTGTLLLNNTGGARSGRVEVFSLTGTSPRAACSAPAMSPASASDDIRRTTAAESSGSSVTRRRRWTPSWPGAW